MPHVTIHHHVRQDSPESLPDAEVFMGKRSPTPLEFDACYGRVWKGEIDLKKLCDLVDVEVTEFTSRPDVFLDNLWLVVEQGDHVSEEIGIPRSQSRNDSIRGFMPGDVVEVDGAAYYCATVGWKPATIKEASP